mmetsp:Transcript_38535/g.99067  ORF Transcript_38535/g.99067 Transcript_38535/m.99067 type:complete len:118 (+) Transcript_38535:516-869(+)
MKAGICCDSLEHCTPAFLLHMRMLDFYPFSYPAFYPTVLLCCFSPTVFPALLSLQLLGCLYFLHFFLNFPFPCHLLCLFGFDKSLRDEEGRRRKLIFSLLRLSSFCSCNVCMEFALV